MIEGSVVEWTGGGVDGSMDVAYETVRRKQLPGRIRAGLTRNFTHESFNVDLLYIHIASISAQLTTEYLQRREKQCWYTMELSGYWGSVQPTGHNLREATGFNISVPPERCDVFMFTPEQ